MPIDLSRLPVRGYVKGVIDSEVRAWIADPNLHDELTEFSCVSATGQSANFRASVFRRDVADHLGVDGVFGFAIAAEVLLSLGPSIEFRTTDGKVLPNGVVDLSALSGEHSEYVGPTRIFLHIQKTAGTSIRDALIRNMPSSRVLLVYPNIPGIKPKQLETISVTQRRMYRFVMGHIFFGIGSAFSDCSRYMTFLREPVARLTSNYWHHRRSHLEVTDPSTKRVVPLSEALNRGLIGEFDNYQCRVISGRSEPLGEITSETVDAAISNVKNCFDFVGLVEDIEKDFPRLCGLLGISNGAVGRLNAMPEQDHSTASSDPDFQKIDWDLVRYRNRFDFELYREIAKVRV